MAPPPGGIAPQSRRVMNLATLLSQIARRLPDRNGLIWGAQRWTWAEIEARSAALAAGLAALGVAKGDRVLVHSRNGNEMVEAMFAIFRLGAVFVPTNFRLLPAEMVELARTARARIALVHGHFPEHAAALAASDAGIATIVRIGPGTLGETSVAALIEAHRNAVPPAAAVEHDDPCWFFFTSGTTGKSKAAVLTHGQMAFVVTNHIADLMPGLSEEDASLVVAPLSHGAGVHLLTQVARGAVSILPAGDRLDVDEAWALVREHGVSNMFTVPTILKLLVEDASRPPEAHGLRHVIYAGAPMYRADQQMILSRLGRVIVQYFGLGEVTGNITVLPARLHDAAPSWPLEGSCGYPRTGMQVAIMDEAGRELGPGETGEICVIGPAVFAGYYDNPEANAKSFRDGWFRTGDLGHVDARGFVYITGRASDMYISGGSNIYPREIEEKVLTHPAIAEVAVVGVPDPKWGEVGIAVCVARAPVAEAELLAWLAERIARYKLPRRVVFWDALPKSGYGKVPKRMVRDELAARGELPGASD